MSQNAYLTQRRDSAAPEIAEKRRERRGRIFAVHEVIVRLLPQDHTLLT
jgi:hypothetical protein